MHNLAGRNPYGKCITDALLDCGPIKELDDLNVTNNWYKTAIKIFGSSLFRMKNIKKPGWCSPLFVALLQALDHFPMGVRVFEVHVEAGRIGYAGVGEPLISAPELNTALIIAIEDPRIFPPTPGKLLFILSSR